MTQPSSSQIEPLQDATEALRIAYRDLPYDLSRLLATNVPDFVAAIEYALSAADTSHIPAPELGPDERAPENLPGVGLYDAALDALPPRKLSDVWEGQGDYDDPLLPEDDHEHELILKRLRDNPEAEWPGGDIKAASAQMIGGDGVPIQIYRD